MAKRTKVDELNETIEGLVMALRSVTGREKLTADEALDSLIFNRHGEVVGVGDLMAEVTEDPEGETKEVTEGEGEEVTEDPEGEGEEVTEDPEGEGETPATPKTFSYKPRAKRVASRGSGSGSSRSSQVRAIIDGGRKDYRGG